jgi:hypothetical protein
MFTMKQIFCLFSELSLNDFLWWLIYAMSYFRFFASKCENAKGQSWTLSSLRVFAFTHFRGNKAKIRQKERENTTHKICRIFAFHLSYFRFFVFKIQKMWKHKFKRRQRITLSFLLIFIWEEKTQLTATHSELPRLLSIITSETIRSESSSTTWFQM